ncbi:MAG: hypothetical protein QM764_12420 [Chitinophagaceae bacterium]
MKKKKSDILFAFYLTLPVIIFFVCYWFNRPSNLIPTGFIQYDNPSYVAYARQYLDAGKFHLFYNNPFNDSDNYSRIYFQTQTLFIAFLLKIGISPAYILTIFTIVCSFLCFFLAIKIFDLVFFDNRFRKLLLLFFCWGGGLLFLANIPLQWIYPSIASFVDYKPIILDPGGGWWGLNFGRSLFFSCEAYYHFLFLATIFFVLKKRWGTALLLLFALSTSHPFTGIELLAIINVWSLMEKFVFKSKFIPSYFTIGVILLLCLHVFYYLYFLNLFPDHHSTSSQYSLNWRIRFFNIIPAYCIVGLFVFITIRKLRWHKVISQDYNRLFLMWFIVAFSLANHELFMRPMQPIHFTRGYIWLPLFLLSIPTINFFMLWLSGKKWAFAGISLFTFIFLSDNLMWIYDNSKKAVRKSVRFTGTEERQILDSLSARSTNMTLIIGYADEQEAILPYLATTSTKAWPWISHPFSTPFIEMKRKSYADFISNGKIDSAWVNRPCIFLFRKSDSLEMKRSDNLSFTSGILMETKSYKVVYGEPH